MSSRWNFAIFSTPPSTRPGPVATLLCGRIICGRLCRLHALCSIWGQCLPQADSVPLTPPSSHAWPPLPWFSSNLPSIFPSPPPRPFNLPCRYPQWCVGTPHLYLLPQVLTPWHAILPWLSLRRALLLGVHTHAHKHQLTERKPQQRKPQIKTPQINQIHLQKQMKKKKIKHSLTVSSFKNDWFNIFLKKTSVFANSYSCHISFLNLHHLHTYTHFCSVLF